MKVFISAGEASGDALGAHLIDAMARKEPELYCAGMGGPMMRARGFEAHRDANEVGVVGLIEILRHLPRLFRLVDALAARAIEMKPDVAVLIDVPDFNIRLAKRLRAAGIKVVFYVGPSVWAWRPGRAKRYARSIDRLLVLFPFELPVWQASGVDVVLVGHPLIDELPAPLAVEAEPRTVALLPGSRNGEIERHLDTMLEVAARLRASGVADRFVLPVAPSLDASQLAARVDRSAAKDSVELVLSADGAARRASIARARLALVASGTATLETALVGRPQVIVYRVSWLTWHLIRPFVRVAFLGIVNLIAGREIAPELLQADFRAAKLEAAARRLLMDEAAYREALAGLDLVRAGLGHGGAAERAAAAVLEVAAR